MVNIVFRVYLNEILDVEVVSVLESSIGWYRHGGGSKVLN